MRTGPAIGCLAGTTRRLGIEVAMRHSNEEPADGCRAPEVRPTVLGRRTIELPNTPAEQSNQQVTVWEAVGIPRFEARQ